MSKTLKLSLLLLFMLAFSCKSFSFPHQNNLTFISGDTLFFSDTTALHLPNKENGSSVSALSMDQVKKKKLISAMLAFPFPFGFMGAHRVMLGCKPWIPVVYVATFGGCFGLLPMIDFCAILLSKDIEQFENNPHVFMWLK